MICSRFFWRNEETKNKWTKNFFTSINEIGNVALCSTQWRAIILTSAECAKQCKVSRSRNKLIMQIRVEKKLASFFSIGFCVNSIKNTKQKVLMHPSQGFNHFFAHLNVICLLFNFRSWLFIALQIFILMVFRHFFPLSPIRIQIYIWISWNFDSHWTSQTFFVPFVYGIN